MITSSQALQSLNPPHALSIHVGPEFDKHYRRLSAMYWADAPRSEVPVDLALLPEDHARVCAIKALRVGIEQERSRLEKSLVETSHVMGLLQAIDDKLEVGSAKPRRRKRG